jgi:FdhD protein
MTALTLTNAARPATFEVLSVNQDGEQQAVLIAGEHPLTLYVDRRELLTVMTLGAAPEALAIGYLLNQRLIRSVEELASVQVDWETGACAVTTRAGIAQLEERLSRRTRTTGCGEGTVFGDLMGEIDDISLRDDVTIRPVQLMAMQEAVRHHETIYKQSGAVHGCALFELTVSADRAYGATLRYFVEDVGRHNAVDAIAGLMALEKVDGSDKVFYTTGRLTSEMVIKCAQMGIPILVSRSGLTKMGYDIAKDIGISLFGRAINARFLLFSGQHRFINA